MSNSVITNSTNLNQTSQNGLAIQLSSSSAVITNSTFTNLSSNYGPAVYAADLPQS